MIQTYSLFISQQTITLSILLYFAIIQHLKILSTAQIKTQNYSIKLSTVLFVKQMLMSDRLAILMRRVLVLPSQCQGVVI